MSSSKIIDDDTEISRERELQAESSLKPEYDIKPEEPQRGVVRVPSPVPSLALSIEDFNYSRRGRQSDYLHRENGGRHTSRSPAPPQTIQGRIYLGWTANKGLFLVIISQFFGSLMNVLTRTLEMEGSNGKGYHPFHILFCRMIITVICASFYMWYKKAEHFPWGMRTVRPLLVARGLLGFFGVFGMYYSLLYLPLSDATVITFLAPSLACWACSFLINEPFTRMEQVAAYVSLFGVVLIARPMSLFVALTHSNDTVPVTSGDGDAVPANATTSSPDRLAADYDAVTPAQRATAVGVAMLGVVGAAGAYTTIRWIGKRAHPLISVNYFAAWCTIVSFVAMLTFPGVGFLVPQHLKDWVLLISLGICGFVMQFLLAAGLQHEKSSRATNMVYMSMLFALTFDKVIWGTTPGFLSIIGSSLILGSAIYVAMHKEQPKSVSQREMGDRDEERGLVSPDIDGQRRDDETDIPLNTLRSMR